MIRIGHFVSRAYLAQQAACRVAAGTRVDQGHLWVPAIRELVARLGATSVLDYGCGIRGLCAALREQQMASVRLAEYDPAIRGKDHMPGFADLVVCLDVLGYVEPEKVDAVLADLKLLARMAVFVTIHRDASQNVLREGASERVPTRDAVWWELAVRRAGFRVDPGPAVPPDDAEWEWAAVLREVA